MVCKDKETGNEISEDRKCYVRTRRRGMEKNEDRKWQERTRRQGRKKVRTVSGM